MPSNLDFDVCITEAHAFLQVAESIENNLGQMLSGGMYPFAVNTAFACELYLKAILIHNSTDGTIKKGHELEKLFGALPASTRTQIEATYSQNCTTALNILLSEINTTFIDWRYAFENGVKINITGIMAFATALKAYVDTLN